MNNILNRFKIPTILGLGIIIAGMIGGVVLTLESQTFLSQASPQVVPQNITISNIEAGKITISWQTSTPTTSFITYGKTQVSENTAIDDRDDQTPKPRSTHHITLKDLEPQTTYQIKIVSGKFSYPEIIRVTTAAPVQSDTEFKPILGSVTTNDNPLDEGIIYLSLSGAVTQSTVVKNFGNFVIPLNGIRKQDLADLFNLEEGILTKVTVISPNGGASAVFKLRNDDNPIGVLKIGQDLDLSIPSPTPLPQVKSFDLNKDGRINSSDYSLVLRSIGKKPLVTEADLNEDGIVDKNDLDLISAEINKKGR